MNGRLDSRAGLAFVALCATLGIQVFTAFAAAATPVLAPMIAAELGVPVKWLGAFVGLVYVGAMAASLVAGEAIGRMGAIRLSQLCVLVCAIGIAIVAFVPVGAAPVMAAAAIIVGAGYGPITPASSHVLIRTTAPARMALTFSIKQTGVPAGAALAGAALPALALRLGWRAAFFAVAAAGLVVALSAQPIRAALDADERPGRRFSWKAAREPLAKVWAHAELRGLSLVGFAYATTQACILSFLVVYLTVALNWALVAAGLGLTAATAAGVIGRIVWGAVADRTGRPRRVLAAIGAIAAASLVGMAVATPQWPVVAVGALCAVLGSTAIGWNGVQLSEVARKSPSGEAGAITGGSGVITFFGVVIGPPLFAVLASLSGSYRTGFVVAAVGSLSCAIALSRAPRARARERRKPAS